MARACKDPERAQAMWQRWYAANKDIYNARRRSRLVPVPRKRVDAETQRKQTQARSRKARYNIEPEIFELLMDVQSGLCAICRKPEAVTYGTKARELSVDHNHTTNDVRGLLCAKCNTAIGLVGEDILVLRAMIDYLESHNG